MLTCRIRDEGRTIFTVSIRTRPRGHNSRSKRFRPRSDTTHYGHMVSSYCVPMFSLNTVKRLNRYV